MNRPHFFLFSTARDHAAAQGGRWQFVLQSLQDQVVLEASDQEPDAQGERLELIALVRGLEALNQPSHVTLVTTSRRVARGLRHGLAVWRASGWQWERYGRPEPIKNADLWRRVDHALQFHDVDCRIMRVDPAHHGRSSSTTLPRPHIRPRRQLAVSAASASRPEPQSGAAGGSEHPLWSRLRTLWEEVADRITARPTRGLAS